MSVLKSVKNKVDLYLILSLEQKKPDLLLIAVENNFIYFKPQHFIHVWAVDAPCRELLIKQRVVEFDSILRFNINEIVAKNRNKLRSKLVL